MSRTRHARRPKGWFPCLGHCAPRSAPSRFARSLGHRRARREPVPSLHDYQWPDVAELDEIEEAASEHLWGSPGGASEPIFDEAEDFDPPVYDYADDWADYT